MAIAMPILKLILKLVLKLLLKLLRGTIHFGETSITIFFTIAYLASVSKSVSGKHLESERYTHSVSK
jgi:hypothetical protein